MLGFSLCLEVVSATAVFLLPSYLFISSFYVPQSCNKAIFPAGINKYLIQIQLLTVLGKRETHEGAHRV